jgi:hypothetical protein
MIRILIWVALSLAICGGLWELVMLPHRKFDAACRAQGGEVDGINRGFWCIKDGRYIMPSRE